MSQQTAGPGAVVAFVGLVLFAVAALGLAWTSGSGDLTLADIGDAAAAVNDAGGPRSAKLLFLERYADGVAVALVVLLAVTATFATLLVPRARWRRVLLGSAAVWVGVFAGGMALVLAGLLGAAVNWFDREGRYGPRVAAVLAALAALALHGYALNTVLFDPDPAPDPAFGVWVGVAGLVAVLAGSAVGTRATTTAAP